ncbi:MAG: hypothetical protein VX460_09090 [Planctomycetota bacterium]|nr:hypothetical protein [Planctomycetota bacterium]
MTRVVLVTEPGHPGLQPDDLELPGAFAELGAVASPAPWGTPWSQITADLCVIRTPWDYFEHADDFLDWVEGAPMPVINPASVLRWNHHKGYLAALQGCGAARIPATAMVPAHDRPVDADALLARVTAERAVLKPAISGGAHQTIVLEPGAAVPWTAGHRGDFLVQAFVDKVEETGEWSLTCFGGAYSHAVRKTAAEGDFRVQEEHGGRVHLEEPPAALISAAERMLRGTAALLELGRPLAYARVDLVEVPYGPPLLMELELIEPELFLRAHEDAPQRFAKACLDAL